MLPTGELLQGFPPPLLASASRVLCSCFCFPGVPTTAPRAGTARGYLASGPGVKRGEAASARMTASPGSPQFCPNRLDHRGQDNGAEGSGIQPRDSGACLSGPVWYALPLSPSPVSICAQKPVFTARAHTAARILALLPG